MSEDALHRFLVPGSDSAVVESYLSLAERSLDATFGFEDEVVVVDIETTGFDPDEDEIIEMAAVSMRGPEVLDRFHTMVAARRDVPLETTRLTGIGNADLVGAPSAEAAVASLAEFVAGRDIVAHHAAFDRSFITRIASPSTFPGRWIDSLQLARIGLPRLRSHRLRDLADAFGASLATHRAADDVEALARVWRVLQSAVDDLPAALVSRLAALGPGAEWPLRGTIAHHAAGRQAKPFDLKDLRGDVRARRSAAFDDADDVECACPPREEVCAHFGAGGVVGRMYEGFEQRDEQTRMADAVLEAFSTQTHLAIEAGTGVGKSVAYLVPSAMFAITNRVSVGIATKTNSLTDQLVYHELPKLADALADEGMERLEYVSLKGYEHYLCLRKLERLATELEDADEETIATVATLLAWVAQSPWGDLDAINVHWRRELRSAVQATQADCTRKRCRYFPNLCYLHGVRRRAASAHVIVTNHALLFRDVVAAGGILPPVRYWVLDEAHGAEAEARKQLTVGATHLELTSVLSGLRDKRGNVLDALRRQVASLPDATSALALIARIQDEAARSATLSDSFFDFVKDLAALVPPSAYEACELRLTPTVRDSSVWSTAVGVGRNLTRRLNEMLANGRELVTMLEAQAEQVVEARADLVGLLSRLAEQFEGLVAVLDGEAEEYVYSVRLDRRRTVDAEALKAARLDVGELLAEEFFGRVHSAVFTSATLAAGEDFSFFAHGVGLDRLSPGAWRALRLASSYDFDRQMSVFVPSDVSPPGSSGYLSSLEQLLEQVHLSMGGSVLTLFTNRREMETLYEALAARLEAQGVSLLMQGRGTSAKRLRDEFIADEKLSLFATKSFWEGFDAKGDTLRCVVVPKLPFGQVNDPLYEERRQRDARAWERYYLPEAVLELKQAAGRLIRSAADCGGLVIADTRVLGPKSYARDFLSALPVRDIEIMSAEEVASAVGRRFGR
jgi:ATP-dependent DNA helicase DinG